MTVIRLLPLDGSTPQSLIVCLHGVGADGLSLQPLGQMLRSTMPTSAVIIPDAPEPSDLGGPGWQWFSIRGVTNTDRAVRIAAAMPWLQAFMLAERKELALDAQQVAVCGFSQGAMMALALADCDDPPGAIASIAGRIAAPIAAQTDPWTRIFVSHGDCDPVVPFACLSEAGQSFRAAGYAVQEMPVRGLGHTVASIQADAVGSFFAAYLPAERLGSAA